MSERIEPPHITEALRALEGWFVEQGIVTYCTRGLRLVRQDAQHCPTCQCNKLADAEVKRAPGNPASKTWHW